MNSGYALSPLAQADLSDIWDYSYSQWGADQADAYVLAIHAACEGLVTAAAMGRLAGQSAEHIRMGYRKEIVGSHLVFFKCRLIGSDRKSVV